MKSNRVGRPLKFTDPEELQKQIDKYFADCKKNDEIPCVTGLAYALDTDRSTLLRYEYEAGTRNNTEICHTIKKAKTRIEMGIEQMLLKNNKSPIAYIFNLKNNFSAWEEKQTVIEETQPRKVFDFFTDRGITKDESEY